MDEKIQKDRRVRLVVLGTGTAMVTHYFNTCFVLDDGEQYFLTDAGGGDGIYRRFEELNLDYQKLHHAFLTHEHTDHILGMICILRKIAHLMRNNLYEGDFYLYCHDVLTVKLHTICQMLLQPGEYALFGDRIHIETVLDGEKRNILHYGFTFFDIHSTKAKQYGYLMTYDEGKKLAFLGDEPLSKYCTKYVDQADWLLSEAFCLYREREYHNPYRFHHVTVREASENAQKYQVKNLILWHTEDETTYGNRKQWYEEEAREYYSGNVYVPEDGDIFEL